MSRAAVGVFLILLVVAGMATVASASVSNRLYRVEIWPKSDYTRIKFHLDTPPQYTITRISGNRLRLSLADTDGHLFRKFRSYSDTNIGGLLFAKRQGELLITFPIAAGMGWRGTSLEGLSAIPVDVGKPFLPFPPRLYRAGREKIWNGVEKLVRDFDPPLKSEFSFVPTDSQVLKMILDGNDQQLFMLGEAALYKGNLSEAEEIFTPFAARQTAVKSLALYRLGETYYKLQKYSQALAAFREAEKIWPAFLGFNPGVTFYYGDSIARGGDLASARQLLVGLIAKLADKKFAPVLLVRLADILARQGHDQEALAIYRTVSENFSDNKASQMASMRLADREFLRATPWDYRRLADIYQQLSIKSMDVDLREEAHFKYALLESLNGESPEALRQVMLFQKKFPRGIYLVVSRTMREVLVAEVYRQTVWDKDAAGLILFVEEHQDFLAGCISQQDFLQKVARAYEAAGRPIELIKLFSFLLERQWAASGTAYMYEAVIDNSELLGDSVMAEKYMRLYLKKFSDQPRARLIWEKLGGLQYSAGKYAEARDALSWLLNKREQPRLAESYYYLGSSFWHQKQYAQAYRAMELYIAQAASRGEKQRPLLIDAYSVAASARESAGDRKGAAALLESGFKVSPSIQSDELLYKAADLNLYLGKKQVARGYYERILKSGQDPEWQRLAQQSIELIDLQVKTGSDR